MKRVSELTPEQLEKGVQHLLAFVEFAFFAEREIDDSTGICLGLEMLALTMGLTEVDGSIYDPVDPSYDSADMMGEFVEALDAVAMEKHPRQWAVIRGDLPYSRGLVSEN